MNERIKNIIKKAKNGKVVVLIGILGILLIFISSVIPKADDSAQKKENFEQEYLESLQNSVTEMVKKICGCKASVVITLDSGFTYNYAFEGKNEHQKSENEEKDNSERKNTLITNQNGSEEPVLINSYLPQIRGVAVVYGAENDDAVNTQISNALKAALGITNKQIFIIGNGG